MNVRATDAQGDRATADGDPSRADAHQLADLFRRGVTDPVKHAEHTLDSARQLGPRIGAFAHLLPDLTLAQAHEAKKRLVSGGAPTLCGVPVPIKALSQVKGAPADSGSRVFAGRTASVTDGTVQDLFDLGTVTIGLTTAPEFGMPAYTEPACFPPARTPWDTRRTAGGSSGGAASAVASGIVPIAHGSDGGGSVRIPAAACGIVGIKPSRGLVSPGPYRHEGVGLTTDGILSRTVADAALGLDAIAHNRPGDAFVAPRPSPSFVSQLPADLRPLRIGVLLTPLNSVTDVHPASLRAVERASQLLRDLGHSVTQVQAPFTPVQWRAFMPLWTGGAAGIPIPEGQEENLEELTRWLRDEGRRITAVETIAAISGMQSLARLAAQAWREFDLILTPSLNGPPAFPADLKLPEGQADFDAQCRFSPWTASWNMFGWAAASVPLHREEIDSVVLPFGVHLGATRLGEDALVLQVAAVLERHDPWPQIVEPSADVAP